MRIEENRSDVKVKVSNESKRKRRQKKVSPVQRLYNTCKEVFADCGPDIVPSPEKIQTLVAVLDKISQADVDLRPNMLFFDGNRAPIITYLQLHECDKFSIGIFCLPPSSVIPLHNHPGMTVFSKLLFGTMHIKSYDWLDTKDKGDANPDGVAPVANHSNSYPDGLRPAKLKVNSEFTAHCSTSVLYPTDGGNMHCFTAKTACAVLDVLGPPYCDPEGRHCQYYFDYPLTDFPVDGVPVPDEEKDGYAWLKERENPEDLVLLGAPYDGPKITET
ncbi:plant cysteine oxidase 2 [Olea europaea subsp. europaea]|uniref:cysteine dioxygenase n=1 Tax=Olea europaea subsp. europaea TaxID=158383 RepID=A0A8S0Q6X5_OLEEU|nr:plant cysteine oxidase 2 [Olea europaea subsp. europaea]